MELAEVQLDSRDRRLDHFPLQNGLKNGVGPDSEMDSDEYDEEDDNSEDQRDSDQEDQSSEWEPGSHISN